MTDGKTPEKRGSPTAPAVRRRRGLDLRGALPFDSDVSEPRTHLTAFLSALPAVNRTTRRALILIGAPVWGLRAVRAFR